MQKKFDQEVMTKFGNTYEDIRYYQIHAFIVEVAELAQEWRGFKHWSENQEPVTSSKTLTPMAFGGLEVWRDKNPLLSEASDGLHFLISIGVMFGYTAQRVMNEVRYPEYKYNFTKKVINEQFLEVYEVANKMSRYDCYIGLFRNFIELCSMLGFTWEDLEKAYYEKHKINKERQANGY